MSVTTLPEMKIPEAADFFVADAEALVKPVEFAAPVAEADTVELVWFSKRICGEFAAVG